MRNLLKRYCIKSASSVSPLVLVAALAISGCFGVGVEVPIPIIAITAGATDWIVNDPPLRSPRVTFPDPSTGTDVTKAWAQLTNAEILNLLSDTHSEISIAKVAADGTMTYLVAQATAEVGTYKVVMDYTDYISEYAVDPGTRETIGMARVGVGLRLTARITTTKAGINLGSLMALGIAANMGQVRGSMTVDSIGIRIAGAGGPILSNATIDETSIQKTLESIAVIQSKIADPTTHLDPQVLWVKPYKSTTKPSEVVKSLL